MYENISVKEESLVAAVLIKDFWYNVVAGTFQSLESDEPADRSAFQFDYYASTKQYPRPIKSMIIDAAHVDGVQLGEGK